MSEHIIFENERGSVSVITPTSGVVDERAIALIPKGAKYKKVKDTEIPKGHGVFADAWILTDKGIECDMLGAKNIAHAIRRNKRQKEFAPLDGQATVPALFDSVEKQRSEIRKKYDDIQQKIDSANSVEDLIAAFGD